MKFSSAHPTYCLYVLLVALFLNLQVANSQTPVQAPPIIEEDFNDCILPTGWTTNLIGYQGATWGIGIPDNPASGGSSIDGTCMVYFDDDITGNSTGAWTAQITSPAFDGVGATGTQLILEADVHFRNWNGSDAFRILVSQNGTTNWIPVAVYQGQNYWGNYYDQYVPALIDITPYAGANMRVRFEYEDGNVWNWWAAFDNFKVSRSLLNENFDGCALPAGWINYIDSGDTGWQIGMDTVWSYDMNGTCMAYFNDDAIGQDADPSTVVLLSPTFDATLFANIILDVDVHFRAYQNSFLAIAVFYNNELIPVRVFSGENFEGYSYQDFGHVTIDISAYRSQDLRVAFAYGDGGSWAWWASFDNVKVSGWGEINDLCTRAEAVTVNGPCVEASNVNAIFDGPADACVDSTKAGIWFSFVAPAGGVVTINSDSDFNDVISVFSGNCNSLTPVICHNRDEFGFTGENVRVTGLIAGQTYFVRVSGRVGTFGATNGTTCVSISSGGIVPPAPVNDNCSASILLNIDANCVSGNNRNATLEVNEPVPSLNNRSRSSVWYRFVAPASGKVEIDSGADFADVITVYSGNCGSLTEVSGTDYGHSITLNGLTAGQTYRVQITGYFATIEGNVCMALKTPPQAPVNDICTDAINLSVGDDCTVANNNAATFYGPLVDLQVPFTEHTASTANSSNYYYRPNQGNTCSISTVYVRYDYFTFTVSTTGNYTVQSYYPQMDGYLHVYHTSFNPNNPCATYVAGNDDFNGIQQSQVNVSLTAGVTYYVVTSAYGASQSGQYTTTITTAIPNATVYTMLNDVNLNGAPTSCDVNPTAAIWFTFTAPASGKIYLSTSGEFVHVASIYSGVCGNLTQVYCVANPSRCADPVIVNNLTPGNQYFLQIASASTPFGYNYGEVCVSIKDAVYEPVKAKVKVFLQGPYLGNGLMSTTLKQYNLIPTEQPFNQPPWNYNGSECADELPANMVDWVLLELRDAANFDNIVDQKAALLLNNGNIVDKGKDAVRFYNIPANESFYIVVRHRNHLAQMSAVTVPLPNMNPYTFNASASYVMGGDTQSVVMPDGNLAMIAGDFNADGVVSVADFNHYQSQASMINQYLDGDCNLDRTVSVADFNLYMPNASVIGIQQIRY